MLCSFVQSQMKVQSEMLMNQQGKLLKLVPQYDTQRQGSQKTKKRKALRKKAKLLSKNNPNPSTMDRREVICRPQDGDMKTKIIPLEDNTRQLILENDPPPLPPRHVRMSPLKKMQMRLTQGHALTVKKVLIRKG